MTGMGFPEWVSRGFIEPSEGFSEGSASQITGNVATLAGHPARSFEQFARLRGRLQERSGRLTSCGGSVPTFADLVRSVRLRRGVARVIVKLTEAPR